VPLSDAAIACLDLSDELADPAFAHVLLAGRRKALGGNAMFSALRAITKDATVHGFRSSFRDWAAEMTSASFEVVETALAHASGSAVVDALMLEKRRDATSGLPTGVAGHLEAAE
jgi:integrase